MKTQEEKIQDYHDWIDRTILDKEFAMRKLEKELEELYQKAQIEEIDIAYCKCNSDKEDYWLEMGLKICRQCKRIKSI